MTVRIEPSWKQQLHAEFEKPYWESLTTFVKSEYAAGPCCPQGKNIFRAFDLTPFDQVKVVILGQDPYHTPGAAMGFCFSVPEGNRAQPSLQNIFKEIDSDLGIARTQTDLSDWAGQGVFLLNSVLTVRAREAGSHAGKGWEKFYRQRDQAALKSAREYRLHSLGQLRDFEKSIYRCRQTSAHYFTAPFAILGA
jgi:uracil-DNA glycosylase